MFHWLHCLKFQKHTLLSDCSKIDALRTWKLLPSVCEVKVNEVQRSFTNLLGRTEVNYVYCMLAKHATTSTKPEWVVLRQDKVQAHTEIGRIYLGMGFLTSSCFLLCCASSLKLQVLLAVESVWNYTREFSLGNNLETLSTQESRLISCCTSNRAGRPGWEKFDRCVEINCLQCI